MVGSINTHIEPTIREYVFSDVSPQFCITQIVYQSATFSVCT